MCDMCKKHKHLSPSAHAKLHAKQSGGRKGNMLSYPDIASLGQVNIIRKRK